MLSIYPACFFKEENGYSVIFPDLDNLATCGENLEEAMTMAVDCLAGHLYTLKQEGKKAPAPSAVSSVQIKQVAQSLGIDDVSDAFVNLVSVDVPDIVSIVAANLANYQKRMKAIKKTLTIPEWLNNAALEKGLNFSQVLQDALKQRLQNA